MSFVGVVFGAFLRFATDFDRCEIFRNHSAASVCPRATNSKFVELDVYQTRSWKPDYLIFVYKNVYSLLFRIVCIWVDFSGTSCLAVSSERVRRKRGGRRRQKQGSPNHVVF